MLFFCSKIRSTALGMTRSIDMIGALGIAERYARLHSV